MQVPKAERGSLRLSTAQCGQTPAGVEPKVEEEQGLREALQGRSGASGPSAQADHCVIHTWALPGHE